MITKNVLRRRADEGSPEAQYDLGWRYSAGHDVQKDDEEAVKWLRKAAEQGHTKSQNILGMMYAVGHGVPRDDVEAAKWFRMAAEQGLAQAQHGLGVMYADGHGVPQDYVEAHMWWNLAAAQGNEEACEKRDIVAKMLTASQVADAQCRAREKVKVSVESIVSEIKQQSPEITDVEAGQRD